MAETDLSAWLSIADAAARIGCSTRTIERLGRAKKLEQRLRRQEGTPPVAVFNPEDVDRIASERRRAPAPFVLPATSTPANGNGYREPAQAVSTRLTSASAEDLIRQFLTLAVQALQSPPSPPVAASRGGEPLWVTVKEAAALLGRTETYVRRQIKAGTLCAELDRGWRIRRTDLEQL
jgi:excisionase family DNA binding protein